MTEYFILILIFVCISMKFWTQRKNFDNKKGALGDNVRLSGRNGSLPVFRLDISPAAVPPFS